MSNAPQISLDQFKAFAAGRKVYLFSVNLEGIGFLKLFTRLGLDIGGFVDSRPIPNGRKRGQPVIHPDRFFAELAGDALVVITAKHRQTKRWAMEQCERVGLKRHETWFITTDLCDYLPTIEVAGLCNLHCITCNMGVPGANKKGGFMSAADYRRVLTKMREEIPFLNSVYLYLWGEPLLNPEIAEIVAITSELGVACEISTNLNDARHLAKVVAAQPEVLVVPCSGVGANFDLTRTGGKWEVFRKNLYELRRLIDEHQADTAVRIHYHMYKHNMQEDYDAIAALAAELGFQFLPILAQIFPEYVLRNVIYGEPLPQEMVRANELLYFPIEDQLAYAQRNASRNCFMLKVFPVVRWNTSVVHCSNLTFPTLSPSYLDTSLEQLLQVRLDNKFCDSCMDHGMHRFFDVAASVKEVDGKRTVVRD